ncbi:hypothetical protein [Nocardia brasiliensis]|uniref:hypothetical protein n=1 Tax=Nocardia brasiliensis TaxID=37326 RepID=UPI00366D63CA
MNIAVCDESLTSFSAATRSPSAVEGLAGRFHRNGLVEFDKNNRLVRQALTQER